MNCRSFLLLLLLAGLAGCVEPTNQKNLPNVILILVDDMGFSDLGAYGSEINTPNIDRMAHQGVRFTSAYNTSKCFPSRACILTGLYSQQTGYHKNFKQPMHNAITLGEMFQSAGYTTLWSGKHHSTENPTDRGFDHYSGLLDGAANHFNPGLRREGEGQPAQKGLKNNPVTYRNWVIEGEVFNPYTPKDKNFYTTDVFTDYALQWMDAIGNDDHPFFLYLSYTAPHDPLMAWPQDIEKYKDRYREGYEKIREERFERQQKLGLLPANTLLSEATHPDWDTLTPEEKIEESNTMAVYAAMIDRLDQNIGRILALLKEQGKLDNTLILFTSDNGGSAEVVNIPGGTGAIGEMTNWKSLGKNWANVANTPYREYKNWSHEGGIKTPLIAYWPERINNKNTISHKPVHFIDFLPTFLEITETDYPETFNDEDILPTPGRSFLSELIGPPSSTREDALFWQWRDGKAVRDGQWKLVAHKEVWELYHLETDPVEEKNLIETEKEKAAQLKTLYQQWAGQFEN